MFEPNATPRVFGLSPGVDFPQALVDGLLDRLKGAPPEALARVHVIVNTARMERRLKGLFDARTAGFLPRIHLLTRLDMLEPGLAFPPAVSPLRRRLELLSLVARLIEEQKELAPRTSLYDLTDSLAQLLDEMQGEGVTPETIRNLDVSDASGHWQRTQKFIAIVQDYLSQTTTTPDKEARQSQLIDALADRWAKRPPTHPVILAGSTGSRGTTMRLMRAIAKLPQGAIVLPGYDFDMPAAQWLDLSDALLSEDHPQYRFHKLASELEISPADIRPWDATSPPSPPRNALISLSLRPAPVTDAWLTEGPKLKDLKTATEAVTLLEAPTPRSEALAIAMRLRAAAQSGQKAAVITPDRMLTRQIAAALDQWDILPDDSAGTPLHLSPPGRFLRHVAALLHKRLDAEMLLTLLKHPLTHTTGDRGNHVLNTQRLELKIRQKGMPYPDAASIKKHMQDAVSDAEKQKAVDDWAHWVGQVLTGQHVSTERPLSDWVTHHIALSEKIAGGVDAEEAGELWQKKAGQEAEKTMQDLLRQAEHGSMIPAADYANMVGALLADGEVRDRDAPHPDIMIWGTLEARVQGADLVILAGLNDGTWPEAPSPDPWLNRKLRHDAGLLLPERRIGLSAHDYQQAIAAPEVWITRSIRSEDAETVASRWINRLCNLLNGLKEQQGPALLDAMRARGDHWLSKVAALENVKATEPAHRPSPRPPVAARPRELAVTDLKHLIRDPYAIYAKRVLRLRKLGPLVQSPDALSRGIVSHAVMEEFVRQTMKHPSRLSVAGLLAIAESMLCDLVPWPTARALWMARLQRIADWFVAQEKERRKSATPTALEDEARGRLQWADIGFSIIGRADRIDQTANGEVRLYDYKTGSVPTQKEQKSFDKQLLIEAAMIEEGAFASIGAKRVIEAVFIGLGSKMTEIAAPLGEEPPHKVLDELRQLLSAYLLPGRGFTSRRMMQKEGDLSDYDLLARFGEWDATDNPKPEDLT